MCVEVGGKELTDKTSSILPHDTYLHIHIREKKDRFGRSDSGFKCIAFLEGQRLTDVHRKIWKKVS